MKTHEQPKPGRALMFSGGMDSYLVHRLWRPEYLVFCAAGHRYERREAQAVERLGLRGAVVVDRTLNLGPWERDDAIVPLRNLLFAAVGSRYADTVWLASLAGEVNWDKTPEFYWTASAALSHCHRTSYWCEGRTVAVESPCARSTKAQLLRQALLAGVTREEVGLTVSCYDPGGFCGRCSSCFKRAVATKLNGWVEEYAVDPFGTRKCWEAVAAALQGNYSAQRRTEVLEAVGWEGTLDEALDRLRGAVARG